MQNDRIAEEKSTNVDNENVISDNQEIEDKDNNPVKEDKLQEELSEQKEKYLRLYSDFENFRRRSAKEKIDFLKSANEELIIALLPVLDDFERALEAQEKKNEESVLAEGVTLIFNKFYKTLEQKGLKAIEAKGKVFDTEEHEAITQMPAPDESLKGKVIEEIEKGYYLNDKVIRYAKVVIGS